MFVSIPAYRKALRDTLKVQNIELSEYESNVEVDYDQTLCEASSFSPRAVPALKLQAKIISEGSEPSDVYKHMHVARILNRNAAECILAAKNGTLPSHRKRHNSAESRPADKRPKIDTFIQDTRELSATLKSFAHAMEQMSKTLEDSFDPEKETNSTKADLRTMVENTMDAGRYFIPILQSLSKVALPKEGSATWGANAELQFEPIQVTTARRTQATSPNRQNVNHLIKGKADAVDSFRSVL
jgi:hypothetical protein